jgi:hypothetical protein
MTIAGKPVNVISLEYFVDALGPSIILSDDIENNFFLAAFSPLANLVLGLS